MKFTLEINATKVLLTADQAEKLTNLLMDCEQITNKYVGASGTTKSHYLKLIDPFSVSETLRFGALSTEDYDATKLLTKLQSESNP